MHLHNDYAKFMQDGYAKFMQTVVPLQNKMISNIGYDIRYDVMYDVRYDIRYDVESNASGMIS
jgi:hypothetical protein